MKSIVLVRPGPAHNAFEMRENKTPEPKEGEVRIDVQASGLNFADVLARMGLYPDAPPLPCVLGYDVVGTVSAAGAGVEKIRPGDRVVAFTRFGGYASSVIAHSEAAALIPEDMEAGAAAALATQYCTAWYASDEMVRLHPGDRVLVQAAAGGVGQALVQMAKRRGCVVFGTAGSKDKLETLVELGVDHPIHYREQDFETEVRRILGNGGLDVVFDSIGGKTFRKGCRLLAPGGRIVTFGIAQVAGNSRNPFRALRTLIGFGLLHPIPLLSRSQGVIGVNMLRIADEKPKLLRHCLQAVVSLAVKDELKPRVGAVFPAEDVADAHELLASRKSTGKIVLEWTPGG